MIFIPCNQVTDHFFVVFLCLHAMFFIKGADLLTIEVSAAAKFQVHTHCCGLVNDNDPLLIAQPHHFLAVRIMAGAETVGSLPFHQGNVFGIHRQIDAAAIREGILMFAISFEIKWFFIDQEFCSVNADRTDAIWKCINVFAKGHADIIKISI